MSCKKLEKEVLTLRGKLADRTDRLEDSKEQVRELKDSLKKERRRNKSLVTQMDEDARQTRRQADDEIAEMRRELKTALTSIERAPSLAKAHRSLVKHSNDPFKGKRPTLAELDSWMSQLHRRLTSLDRAIAKESA